MKQERDMPEQSRAADEAGFVRRAAVAGRFYPADPATLEQMVRGFMREASPSRWEPPRAVIAPHAGYVCSGIVAGAGFQALSARPQAEHTVYLMGPAHWLPVYGVGLSSASAFTTPLGAVSVHAEQVRALAARGRPYSLSDAAHAPEHCLEVELPFLQTALPGCRIVPMLFDDGAQPERIAADLGERLASDPHSIVVVSSDLSHYQPYAQAQKVDRTFLDAVASGDVATAAKGQACGLQPILCLMILARQLGWTAHVLDYRNSGDTCGPRSEVVGYGSVIFVP
jgi:AmmeMemoRadiSam system protein B